MAIALGTPQFGSTTGTNTLTVTGLTPTGSNTALFAGVGSDGTTGRTTTSVTFAGVAMTEDWDFEGTNTLRQSGHHLVAPATSGDLVVTLSGVEDDLGLGGLPLSGVDQATPIGAIPANASGASATASVTVVSAVGELVVANLYAWWSHATPGANEAEQWDQLITSLTHGCYTEAGAPSVVINPTRTAGATSDWTINALTFKPAAGAARSFLLVR